MRHTSLIYTLFFFLAACDRSDEPVPETHEYLPLAVGNYWDFQTVGQPDDGITQHREVVDYVTINEMNYYLLVSNFLQPYKDSAYYRIDDNGFVYVFRKSLKLEENLYRLDGHDGDTWSYPFVNNSIANIKLTELSRNIKGHEVDNCKDYAFDVEQWADEEYTFTLAPGVGFIREFSDAWGGGYELKSARIGGKVIGF